MYSQGFFPKRGKRDLNTSQYCGITLKNHGCWPLDYGGRGICTCSYRGGVILPLHMNNPEVESSYHAFCVSLHWTEKTLPVVLNLITLDNGLWPFFISSGGSGTLCLHGNHPQGPFCCCVAVIVGNNWRPIDRDDKILLLYSTTVCIHAHGNIHWEKFSPISPPANFYPLLMIAQKIGNLHYIGLSTKNFYTILL